MSRLIMIAVAVWLFGLPALCVLWAALVAHVNEQQLPHEVDERRHVVDEAEQIVRQEYARRLAAMADHPSANGSARRDGRSSSPHGSSG